MQRRVQQNTYNWPRLAIDILQHDCPKGKSAGKIQPLSVYKSPELLQQCSRQVRQSPKIAREE